jgi:hypothetical protein
MVGILFISNPTSRRRGRRWIALVVAAITAVAIGVALTR